MPPIQDAFLGRAFPDCNTQRSSINTSTRAHNPGRGTCCWSAAEGYALPRAQDCCVVHLACLTGTVGVGRGCGPPDGLRRASPLMPTPALYCVTLHLTQMVTIIVCKCMQCQSHLVPSASPLMMMPTPACSCAGRALCPTGFPFSPPPLLPVPHPPAQATDVSPCCCMQVLLYRRLLPYSAYCLLLYFIVYRRLGLHGAASTAGLTWAAGMVTCIVRGGHVPMPLPALRRVAVAVDGGGGRGNRCAG